MKYVLTYTLMRNRAFVIFYIKGFMYDVMDWRENGRCSNAQHFSLKEARYIKKQLKHRIYLDIKSVKY